MAPTVTETSLLKNIVHRNTDCQILSSTLKPRQQTLDCNPLDTYDQSRPKSDPKWLDSIRAIEKKLGFKTALRWQNIILIMTFHFVNVFVVIYKLRYSTFPVWQTVIFSFFLGGVAGFGITGGAHRYWCHRSFKAKRPLQIILMCCYSVAGQNTIYEWVRDHRVHHKFSETSADPHDAHRGFFFSHVGWLMMKKHPDVIKEGSKIDMTDITNDPLIKFHTKHFILFKSLFCFIVPTLIPVYCWDESWAYAIISQPMLRYMFSLNFTWSVNSFAHLWGNKPYDKHIMPVENWGVSLVAMGEGWHNYHHTFPWDYKAAELQYLNITTTLLNFFAKIGWAYDLKTASPSLIKAVIRNRGELSDPHES